MEENKKDSGLAMPALIISIVAMVLAFIPYINIVCYVLVPLALIYAIISLAKNEKKGMSTAAIVLSLIASLVMMTVSMIIAGKTIYNEFEKSLDGLDSYSSSIIDKY